MENAFDKSLLRRTEQRLYAYLDLERKRREYRKRLRRLREGGETFRSTSVVRFMSSGSRLTREQILEAMERDLERRIAATEYELREITKALTVIKEDRHFNGLALKYFRGLEDRDIARELRVDISTVRRNRQRLLKRLGILLYGADVLEEILMG